MTIAVDAVSDRAAKKGEGVENVKAPDAVAVVAAHKVAWPIAAEELIA